MFEIQQERKHRLICLRGSIDWVVIDVSGGVVCVSSPRVRRLNDERR